MLHLIRNIVLFSCFFITGASLAQTTGNKIYSLGGEYQEPPRINTIYQLKNGYILLGTTKGLYKFNGIGFSDFSKESFSFSSISFRAGT